MRNSNCKYEETKAEFDRLKHRPMHIDAFDAIEEIKQKCIVVENELKRIKAATD